MHPVLIQVTDNFFIGTYGLMIVLGMVLGVGLNIFLGKRRGLPSEVFFDILFIAVIAGFVGARLLYILTDLPGFLRDPMAYLLSRSGFVFLGGLIGAAIACGVYLRMKNLPFWRTADTVVPGLAVAHAFGRVGCHYAGCCFGGTCEGPLGIEVPRIAMPDGSIWPNVYLEHVVDGRIAESAAASLPVWPVQLMETGGLLLLMAVMVLLFLRRPPLGMVFGVYLVGYSILRFFLEFLRGDEIRGYLIEGMLTTSQGLSVLLLAAGIYVLAVRRKAERWNPEESAKTPPDEEKPDTTAGRIRSRKKKGGR